MEKIRQHLQQAALGRFQNHQPPAAPHELELDNFVPSSFLFNSGDNNLEQHRQSLATTRNKINSIHFLTTHETVFKSSDAPLLFICIRNRNLRLFQSHGTSKQLPTQTLHHADIEAPAVSSPLSKLSTSNFSGQYYRSHQHNRSNINMATTFICSACKDDCDTIPVEVANWQVCEDCFRGSVVPQFEAALHNESMRRVKLANIALDIEDYAPRFFSAAFVRDWKAKEAEFATPIRQRLYCRNTVISFEGENEDEVVCQICGAFLCSKESLDDVPYAATVRCLNCTGRTCVECGEPCIPHQHECEAPEKPNDPFAGMTKGEDYQVCPNETCQVKLGLLDGCNHMQCPFCETDLCFVCGAKAKDRSGHWDLGKPCPRFGKKGSERAVHDRPVVRLPLYRAPQPPQDPARRAEIAREEADIMATPEGRLFTHHRARLAHIHDNIVFLESFVTEADRLRHVNLAHSIVHNLEAQLEVYITDLRDVSAPQTPFRDVLENRFRNARIEQQEDLMGDMFPEMFQELKDILESYFDAWLGPDWM